MKCLSCDRILTDHEATRKSVNTGEYIDLCDDCFETIREDVVTLEDDTILTNDADSDE